MVLIIGGKAQGKEAFAKSQFGIPRNAICYGADCTLQQIKEATLLCNLEALLQRLQEGIPDETWETWFTCLLANASLVITCAEVGSGVVPLQKQEREYRDLVGAASLQLATHAQQVYRVFCGIGTKIKG